ncbi:MAG: hypothetical protein H7319_12435 [Spirosoma sp.]|nr:hypothetical protein [Spirosoma sp.]
MRISEFVQHIQSDGKKRTGIVLAYELYGQVVTNLRQTNATVVDCADLYDKHLLLTDDELLKKIREAGGNKAVLLLNLELFIAPRMPEGTLDLFGPKLAAEEPRQALIILLYSRKIFKKFDQIFQRTPATQSHTLNLSEESS